MVITGSYYGKVVTPGGVVDPGRVEVAGGRIAAVGPAPPQRHDAGWILPGFVDIHVHGGGGYEFGAHAARSRKAARFHLRHGTTTMLASLSSAPLPQLRAAVRSLGRLVRDGLLAGVHLEGPYLSLARRGAHPAECLRGLDLVELAGLLDQGEVRMLTLAPELPGALEAISLLRGRGVLAAVGHTDATYAQTVAAIEAGARAGTHVGNAMAPIRSREPGPVVALLGDPRVVLEQIADGIHLHDAMLRHVVERAGAGRVALVTDATAAAGMPDGEYRLGKQDVLVRGGVATTAGGALAGSTVTMAACLRRVVHNGATMVAAAAMAALTPARLLGLDAEVGSIEVGKRADLVFLDQALSVTRVLREGVRVRESKLDRPAPARNPDAGAGVA